MSRLDPRQLHAANTDIVRDINRRIVLNFIRTRQPISRADVARASGLQRSTVSAIVEQLIHARWVEEGARAQRPRGRRPVHLRLNDRRAIIGIDIRPLNTTIAISDVNANFATSDVIPTAANPATGIRQIIEVVREAMQAHPGRSWEGIGISLPGRWNAETGRLGFAPNLNWRDADLRTPMARATGLDVELENAANACALAEVWFGGEREPSDLVVITVSEGVGAAVFANGQLVRGRAGMAGEFGHIILDPSGPRCRCGNRGCWEVFASNTAALRYYAQESRKRDLPTFIELLALADAGDACARHALDGMAHWLGRGAAILSTGLAPASLIFVGEVTRAWPRVHPIIERELAGPLAAGTRVVAAGDGAISRLRGAVALVLQKHLGGPSYV